MVELIRKLCEIPDAYDSFILGMIAYFKNDNKRVKTLLDYLNKNANLTTSDVVYFVSKQPDFIDSGVKLENKNPGQTAV